LQKGIDFEGGTQVVIKAAPGTTAQEMRDRLSQSEFASVTIQQYGDPKDAEFLFRVKDAAGAVSTATVNSEAAGDTAGGEGVATRLLALLGGDLGGKSFDINSVGTKTLTDALDGAGLGSEEASAAATAIVEARTDAGGLLLNLDGLAAVGVPQAAVDWLVANAAVGTVSVLTHESVGPEVGEELRGQAIRAVLWSMVGILAYVAFRFEFRFGVGAIVATLHDVLITLGFLAILKQPIDTSVIAAILTVVGFSLNDTVVVFDRIRELMKVTRGMSFSDVIDQSINITLSRTMLTTGLTLVSVLALLFWGGPVLRGFALTLTVGIIVGTYSSIFVASPIVLWWDRLNERRLGHGARSA
jgi:preprotein translocase subunit SecF